MSEEQEKGAVEEATPKKSKKMLFIVVGLVVLLLVGGGVFFMMGGKGAKAAGEEHEEVRHLALAKLEPFIVNLSRSGAFLKVVLLIEYDQGVVTAMQAGGKGGGAGHGGGGSGGGEADATAPHPAFVAKMPIIRDAVIKVLSSKKTEEVLSTDGKEQLKTEITEAINQIYGLDDGPVTSVYFVEFIVQ